MNNDHNYFKKKQLLLGYFHEFYTTIIQNLSNPQTMLQDWTILQSILEIETLDFDKINTYIHHLQNQSELNDSSFNGQSTKHINNQALIPCINSDIMANNEKILSSSVNNSLIKDDNVINNSNDTKLVIDIDNNTDTPNVDPNLNLQVNKIQYEKVIKQEGEFLKHIEASLHQHLMEKPKEKSTNQLSVHPQGLDDNASTNKQVYLDENSMLIGSNNKTLSPNTSMLNISHQKLQNKSYVDNSITEEEYFSASSKVDDSAEGNNNNKDLQKSQSQAMRNSIDRLNSHQKISPLKNLNINNNPNTSCDTKSCEPQLQQQQQEQQQLNFNLQLIKDEIETTNSKRDQKESSPIQAKPLSTNSSLTLLPGKSNNTLVSGPDIKPVISMPNKLNPNLPYNIVPSIDYISKALNKPHSSISNHTVYTNLSIMEVYTQNNTAAAFTTLDTTNNNKSTFYIGIILHYFMNLLNDRYNTITLTSLYEKIQFKHIKLIFYKEESKLTQALLINLRLLIDEKLRIKSNRSKSGNNSNNSNNSNQLYGLFLELFFKDMHFQNGLIALIKELLIEHICSLDAKTFLMIFPNDQKNMTRLLNSIRSNGLEPTEELISLIPNIIQNNIEIHYMKENKIEIVLYNMKQDDIIHDQSQDRQSIILICTKTKQKYIFQSAFNKDDIVIMNKVLIMFNEVKNKDIDANQRKENEVGDNVDNKNQIKVNAGKADALPANDDSIKIDDNTKCDGRIARDTTSDHSKKHRETSRINKRYNQGNPSSLSSQQPIPPETKNPNSSTRIQLTRPDENKGRSRYQQYKVQTRDQQTQQKQVENSIKAPNDVLPSSELSTPANLIPIAPISYSQNSPNNKNTPSTSPINKQNQNNLNIPAFTKAHSLPIHDLEARHQNQPGFNRSQFMNKIKDLSGFFDRHTHNLLQYFPKEFANYEPIRPNFVQNIKQNTNQTVPKLKYEAQKPIVQYTIGRQPTTLFNEPYLSDPKPTFIPSFQTYVIENKENNYIIPTQYLPTLTPQYTISYNAPLLPNYTIGIQPLGINTSIGNYSAIETKYLHSIENTYLNSNNTYDNNNNILKPSSNKMNLKVIPTSSPPRSIASNYNNNNNINNISKRQISNMQLVDHMPIQVRSPLKKIAVYTNQRNPNTYYNIDKEADNIGKYINKAQIILSPTKRIIVEDKNIY